MFVHSSRLRKQLEYLGSIGINAEAIFEHAKFTEEELLDPEKTFSIDQYMMVLEFAVNESNDDYYGLKMGQEPHIAGTIGMMCASCKNLKEAFVQGCKYFQVQGDFAEIKFFGDKQFPRIQYEVAQSWITKAPETARHEVDAMFSFLTSVLKLNSNNIVKPFRINLVRKKPDDVQVYEQILGVVPHFGEQENEMIFREKDLRAPMKAFNPETFILLRAHVEAQLKRFNSETLISEKVRSILLSSIQYSFPDIDTVASRLNMSSRKLQRMLSNEKTTFKTLLQGTRFDLAKQFLRQKGFTVSEISYMLGYSDLGNFSRSFKKFTGQSPQEFRKKITIR